MAFKIYTKEKSKVEIKKLVDKYNKLVQTNQVKDYTEAQTRNAFIEPLFEYLGWDMRNTITANEVTPEENISGKRVDLAFRLYEIPIMFLEAKAMKVDLDEKKWAEQAINYAWNKGVTWAVLTDFISIKIFNAEIPPNNISQNLFIEIQSKDFLDRFEQLWLLSKESFEKKALTEEAKKWGKITKRQNIGEKLFNDLMLWRVDLTKAYKNNGKNNVNIEEEVLDEGVQKILDRFIFIRTAEDRRIEENVLLPLIRSGKSKLYKSLIKIFRNFDHYFNSKLFDIHNCENWEIDDKIIHKIIKGLYQTENGYRYDFSIISADILGGMYEEYLSFILKKSKKRVKVVEGKQHEKKKKDGIFYTPKYIVDFIIKETVGKILKKTKFKDLHKIKILDPACGSGSFLINTFDTILNYKQKQGKSSLFSEFETLENNIFGVDLDPQAIEIAQLNLLLKVLSKKTKLPTLNHNLNCGNSLISGDREKMQKYFGYDWRKYRPFNWDEEFKEVFAQGGFDCIIGNPPYVFARGNSFTKMQKKYFDNHYRLINYQINTYLLFIEQGYNFLKEGGYFGFIIPNTWLTIDTFSTLRKFLLEQVGSLQIINIYDKVFEDANVDTCILIFKKSKRSKIALGEFREGKFNMIGKFSPDIFNNTNYIINISIVKSQNKMMILNKIKKNSQQLDKFSIVKSGLKAYETGKGTPPQTDIMKQDRVYHSNYKLDNSYIKYLEGKNVIRYRINWNGQYLKYGNCLAAPRQKILFTKRRILVRQIPSKPPYSINAMYTNKFLLNDINSMIIFKFKIDPFFILAILNSKLTTFWFLNTLDKLQRKTFPQFKVKELATFPIPNTNETQRSKIAKWSELMIDLHNDLSNITQDTSRYTELQKEINKLDEIIDNEVYKLYDLTEEEIRILEQG